MERSAKDCGKRASSKTEIPFFVFREASFHIQAHVVGMNRLCGNLWQPLIDFSKWVVIYFLLINSLDSKKKLYIFVLIFLLLNFKYAQFAVRLWAKNGFYTDPRGFHEGAGIGSAFFKNPNDFGVAMNAVIGVSYYMIKSDTIRILQVFKMKWFHLFSTVCIFIAVLASSSRGAALALGVALIGIWYKSKVKYLGVAILILAAITFISLIPEDNWMRFKAIGTMQDESGQSRLALWRAGIHMAQ